MKKAVLRQRLGGRQQDYTSWLEPEKKPTTTRVAVSHTLVPGLLRVNITASASREVKWRVKFNPAELQPETTHP